MPDTTPTTYDRLVEAGFPKLEPPYFYRIEDRSELSAIAVQLRRSDAPVARVRFMGDTSPGFVSEVVLDLRSTTPHAVLPTLAELTSHMVREHRMAAPLAGDYGPAVSS